ncbi:hypothetical protein C8R43DRAFT_959839 [Mycena crocata]|nr:hypothetical protein C8R43DRAFT_959839 [Mycena crocata]
MPGANTSPSTQTSLAIPSTKSLRNRRGLGVGLSLSTPIRTDDEQSGGIDHLSLSELARCLSANHYVSRQQKILIPVPKIVSGVRRRTEYSESRQKEWDTNPSSICPDRSEDVGGKTVMSRDSSTLRVESNANAFLYDAGVRFYSLAPISAASCAQNWCIIRPESTPPPPKWACTSLVAKLVAGSNLKIYRTLLQHATPSSAARWVLALDPHRSYKSQRSPGIVMISILQEFCSATEKHICSARLKDRGRSATGVG